MGCRKRHCHGSSRRRAWTAVRALTGSGSRSLPDIVCAGPAGQRVGQVLGEAVLDAITRGVGVGDRRQHLKTVLGTTQNGGLETGPEVAHRQTTALGHGYTTGQQVMRGGDRRLHKGRCRDAGAVRACRSRVRRRGPQPAGVTSRTSLGGAPARRVASSPTRRSVAATKSSTSTLRLPNSMVASRIRCFG